MPCHTYCDCKFDGSSKLQWKRWREGFSFFSIVISLVLGRFGSHAYVQKRRVLGLGNTEECPFTSVVLHISKKGLPPHTFSQTPLRLYYTMPIDCPHFDIDGLATILVRVSHFIINHHTLQTSIKTNDTLQTSQKYWLILNLIKKSE